MRVNYYSDGTVRYWSVYQQSWHWAQRVEDRELAAMDPKQRERVIRHTSAYCDGCGRQHTGPCAGVAR